ncbi:MAG: hypothetical protein M3P22_00550 [bacterium]|nr:hypothetical protein [bacterium]
MKNKCEKCNMDGEYMKVDDARTTHYFCDHHKVEGATKIDIANSMVNIKQESKLKKFLPIIIIFSVIILSTSIAVYIHGFTLEFTMRMMMGLFFLIFGLFKIFNLSAFADAYSTYDLIAMRSSVYGFIYPFLELMLALLYFINVGGIYRDIFTLVLMLVSAWGVYQKIKQKEEVPCACLGMVFKLPMTWITLVENLIMALEALVMIIISFNL